MSLEPVVPNADYVNRLLATLPESERSPLRLGMTLIRLSRISESLLERSAIDFGLNSSEATTLSALLLSGPPHQMLPSEITRRVAHTSAGVTGILRRLETKQLVSRRADPSDGRRVFATLTPQGEQLIREFLRHRATMFAGYFGDIDPDDLIAMIDSIGTLLARLERAAGYSPAFNQADIASPIE